MTIQSEYQATTPSLQQPKCQWLITNGCLAVVPKVSANWLFRLGEMALPRGQSPLDTWESATRAPRAADRGGLISQVRVDNEVMGLKTRYLSRLERQPNDPWNSIKG